MEDNKIIGLLWNRSEQGLKELAVKYGGFLYRIAMNLLGNHEDSEECVDDTYIKTWDTIPPTNPKCLKAYTGKITRNLALNRIKFESAEKRGKNLTSMLSELEDCIPSPENVQEDYLASELASLINSFVLSLEKNEQYMFVQRYWAGESPAHIAKQLGIPENTVNWKLFDLRKKLKTVLESCGYAVP